MVFDRARNICLQSPVLKDKAQCQHFNIKHKDNYVKYISRNADNQHGHYPSAIVIDDFQECETELYDVLKSGTAKLTNSLMITIGTAGHDRESIAYKQYEHAKRVAEGTINDPTFLPYICEVPEDEDWEDESNWHKANPHLGLTVPLDNIRSEYQKAKTSPQYENTFRMLHLNQWRENMSRWLAMDYWPSNNKASDINALKSHVCFGGLDTAAKTDLNALTLIFPNDNGYDVVSHFWVPAWKLAEREKRDNFSYSQYVKSGLIHTFDSDVVEPDQLRKDVADICKLYDVKSIGIDRDMTLMIQMQADGLPIVECPFSPLNISEAALELERLYLKGCFNFYSNPVMRWHLSNAALKTYPTGLVLPHKGSSFGRMDGVSALTMALKGALSEVQKQVARRESYYESAELEVI